MMKWIRNNGLTLAWVASLFGVLMSLYYSEIAKFDPCEYCWLQRVALFPMALLLGIFAFRQDREAWIYILPLCFFGLLVAILQAVDYAMKPIGTCTLGSCHKEMVYLFNFIPFPWISGFGFLLIAGLVWLSRRK